MTQETPTRRAGGRKPAPPHLKMHRFLMFLTLSELHDLRQSVPARYLDRIEETITRIEQEEKER